jgi:23S rRNA (pseudouridine1915-N3)-methyltransferase
MKIIFCSIGKPHDTQLKLSIDTFTKRVSNYFSIDWLIIPPPKNAGVLSEVDLKKAEAALLFAQIAKEDYLILLDERGKNIGSPDVANLIQQRANESCKRIVFVIGGAFGVDAEVFKRANYVWSLSNLVFPHMIVRLLLSEQVYRACTILKNEKYHHV